MITEKLESWRTRHGIADKPMIIAEMAKYKLHDPSMANLSDGDLVSMIRRPDNASDKNAIEITKTDGMTLGYLPREISAILAPILDSGEDLFAHFHSENNVASGMMTVFGDALGPHLADLSALADEDTVISVKRSAKDITNAWYEDNAVSYCERASRCNTKRLIDDFLSDVKPGGRVLDVGCGSGRDLATISSRGYEAHGMDASAKMCSFARDISGADVQNADFQSYDFGHGVWDGIWAMASLLHADKADIPDIIARMREGLAEGGKLYVSMKIGDEPAMEGGRMMTYLTRDEFTKMFGAGENDTVFFMEANGSNGDRFLWGNVTSYKEPEPSVSAENSVIAA